MKIVNRKTFLQLPIGTLFSEYEPCVFYGLFVKTGHCSEDYFEKELIGNVKCNSSGEFAESLEHARLDSSSVDLDFEIDGRNGAFKMDQLYAVYEKQDIKQLIDKLVSII